MPPPVPRPRRTSRTRPATPASGTLRPAPPSAVRSTTSTAAGSPRNNPPSGAGPKPTRTRPHPDHFPDPWRPPVNQPHTPTQTPTTAEARPAFTERAIAYATITAPLATGTVAPFLD